MEDGGSMELEPGRLPGRRAVIAAALAAAGVAVLPAAPASAAPAPAAKGRRRIPAGYGQVDPRTADRVALTLSLRDGVPLFPGDPQFTWEVFADSAYRRPTRALTGIELNGWGYRWLRLE